MSTTPRKRRGARRGGTGAVALALLLAGFSLTPARAQDDEISDDAARRSDEEETTEAETPPDETSEPAGAFAEAITVRARSLGESARRSLDAEAESLRLVEVSSPDRLGRFPDRDAAGAAQRLPGITVLRDQGDARLVLVRGFLPSFNSATLDGERIPAGEADERAVALDLVPTELLEAIEVTKTPTPDMDGDAIGGTVELVTRRPPPGRRVAVSLGTGHDDGADGERSLATATLGRTLAARRLGWNLSLSHRDAERGVDSLEILRDDGVEAERRLQDHQVERRRDGAAAVVEWSPRAGTDLRLRALWSEFEDVERRRARVFRRAEGEDGDEGSIVEARELKDRPESQELTSIAFDGRQALGAWQLRYRSSWARGEEADPDRLDTIFVADPEADGGFALEEFRTESDRSQNEDLVLALDLERFTGRDGRDRRDGRWQFGVKQRQKDLRRDDNLRVFSLADDADDVALAEIAGGTFRPADPFFDGRIDFGADGLFPDPARARELFAAFLGAGFLDVETDAEEDLGDFRAEEDTSAAYGLLELDLGAGGDTATLLAGARWERSETDYLGSEIVIGGEPEEEGTRIVPVRGGGSYDEILPSAVLRLALGEGDTLRAGLSRTLARPDLEALAPSRLVVFEDQEIIVGNPDLVPTTAWNLDLAWRRGLEPLGSLSLALYAKELSDVIVETRTPGDPAVDGPASFTRVEPRNAGDATVVGLELAFQNRFHHLPPPFDGLGLLANLAWSDADADLFGRPAMPLPGQADLSGTVVLSYEKGRVSARLLYSYRDEIVEELGESAERDVHLEARGQLDLSWQVQLTRRWALFGETFNLGEEPTRRFEGTSQRPIFEERGGWWATLGARFDL